MSLKKTGDDKQSFAGKLGAIGNFIGQDGNAVTLQPTGHSIYHYSIRSSVVLRTMKKIE